MSKLVINIVEEMHDLERLMVNNSNNLHDIDISNLHRKLFILMLLELAIGKCFITKDDVMWELVYNKIYQVVSDEFALDNEGEYILDAVGYIDTMSKHITQLGLLSEENYVRAFKHIRSRLRLFDINNVNDYDIDLAGGRLYLDTSNSHGRPPWQLQGLNKRTGGRDDIGRGLMHSNRR